MTKIVTLDGLTYYDTNIKEYIAEKDKIVADTAASGIYDLNEGQVRINKRIDELPNYSSISIEELDEILV